MRGCLVWEGVWCGMEGVVVLVMVEEVLYRSVQAGENCQQCEEGCERPRPPGCIHPCLLPCHAGMCMCVLYVHVCVCLCVWR